MSQEALVGYKMLKTVLNSLMTVKASLIDKEFFGMRVITAKNSERFFDVVMLYKDLDWYRK